MQNDIRPLSPHLQVYRWQLTMFLSILHRATGFGLALGAVLLAAWLLSAVKGPEAFAQFHAFAESPLGKTMLFCWLYALVFHFLNGIRHLVWDTGRWLQLKSAYASGYAVFFGSIIVTVLIWACAGGQ
jgi:succinate dehydrogenase / fumarate reductase cytochrome b subunit